jgi:hypothetical protein
MSEEASKESNYQPQQWITKKRYAIFLTAAKELLKEEELYESLIQIFKESFNYDPTKTNVSKKTLERVQEKRDKLKAEGISTYISANVKKSYEKKKALLKS